MSEPTFTETFCSQCGKSFGPGDSGFSHCEDHDMTKEELDKIKRREPKELLADAQPIIAITMELNMEWWRGYHVGRDVKESRTR